LFRLTILFRSTTAETQPVDKMKFLPSWTSSRKSSLYHVVSASDDDCDSKEVLLEENNVPGASYRGPKCNRRLYISLAFNATLAICVLVLSIPKLQRHLRDPFNNYLIKQVSMPCRSDEVILENNLLTNVTAPILNQLHIPLRTERRDGSLLPGNPPSLFRQEPSDAVDEAWNRLTNINPIPISAQDVRNIGYDPEIVARWPEEYGLGDDAYSKPQKKNELNCDCEKLTSPLVGRLDVFHEVNFAVAGILSLIKD
jgi:hypothetical protein